MIIISSTVHKIIKSRNSNSSIKHRTNLLPDSAQLQNLLSGITKVYNERTGKSYGVFKTDDTLYPFSSYLDAYLSGRIDFMQFTMNSMSLFKTKIDKENLATGGYILFMHYQHNRNNYLIVVMLNDKSGFGINDVTLDILDATYLELDKLHLATRIDVEKWKNEPSQKYLSFVKGRASLDNVSLYFRDFLGCTDYTDAKEQTIALYRITEDYCEYKNYPFDIAVSFKQKVFNYCNDKLKCRESVYIEDLSHSLDENNPHEFLEFANREEYSLSNGFEPHRDTLKKFRRYAGGDKDLRISFESELLGDRILYDKTSKSLTINKLPSDLQKQLDELYCG